MYKRLKLFALVAIVLATGVASCVDPMEQLENEQRRTRDLQQFEQRKVRQMDDPSTTPPCPCRPGGCC